MTKETKLFWLATSSLVGTIIGVGIFGVPYAISQVGVVLALVYFAVLGGIQLLQHLFFAEAAMACPDKHRLPGLVGLYLGPRSRKIAAVANMMGLWAGMMAYIIVGGEFLNVLLGRFFGGSDLVYQLVWAAVMATVIYFGPSFVSRLGLVGTAALAIAMGAIFLWAGPHVRLANLPLFNLKDFFLPYGVILFSLGGIPAILEMEDTLEGRHEHFRRAVYVGTGIGALLIGAFGFVVYGVTGPGTTQDGVGGLQTVLGAGVATLAAAVGFLAIMNCSFNVGNNVRTTLQYDYKLSPFVSWLVAMGVPFGLFLMSAKSFVSVISFSGAVFGGISAIMVAFLYIAVTKKKLVPKPLGVPAWVAYVCIAVLVSGAGYQIFRSAERLLYKVASMGPT